MDITRLFFNQKESSKLYISVFMIFLLNESSKNIYPSFNEYNSDYGLGNKDLRFEILFQENDTKIISKQ